MAEESDEAKSDTSRGVNDSMLPGHGPVEERRRDVVFSLKCIKDKWIPITVTVVITALIITIIALAAMKTPPCPPHVTAACPDGWVGYQGKCYYFSETEGNWSASQSHCSSLSASLASIDSLPELDFMLRYKGIPYHWIGLQREPGQGQPWKWTNGTIFNNLFQVRGEGQCAYLDEQGVSSSRCYSDRHFICRWPDSAPTSPPRICTAASSLPLPPQSAAPFRRYHSDWHPEQPMGEGVRGLRRSKAGGAELLQCHQSLQGTSAMHLARCSCLGSGPSGQREKLENMNPKGREPRRRRNRAPLGTPSSQRTLFFFTVFKVCSCLSRWPAFRACDGARLTPAAPPVGRPGN